MNETPKFKAVLAGPALRTQSDEQLVSLARDGHEAAFEAIVDRYRKPLVSHCRKFLGADLAEDAVQQTFTVAYKQIIGNSPPAHLRAWLYRVAGNVSVSTIRRKDTNYNELNAELEGADRPEEAFERSEEVTTLLATLKQLPERERSALLMNQMEGKQFEEIALIMGATPAGVKQLAYRARRRLREACAAVLPVPLLLWLLRGKQSTSGKAGVAAAKSGGGIGATKVAAILLAAAGVAFGVNAITHNSSTKDARAGTPPAAKATPAPSAPIAAAPSTPSKSSPAPASAAPSNPAPAPTGYSAPTAATPAAGNQGGQTEKHTKHASPKKQDDDKSNNKNNDSTGGNGGGTTPPTDPGTGNPPSGGTTTPPGPGPGPGTPPDTTAPETTIDSAALGTTTDSTPTLDFSSTESGSSFACSIDGAAPASCSSPHTTVALPAGTHTFDVAATDAAGNADPTPAGESFTVTPFAGPLPLIGPTATASDFCGQSTAFGDFNGDGRADVLTGCRGDDTGAAAAGNAVLFTRNASNDDFDAGNELPNPTPNAADNCGTSVSAGDVNGDGRDDLVMGCTSDDTGALNAGSLVLYTRNLANNGFDAGVVLPKPGAVAGDSCGGSVAIGDLNGDGDDDLIMGCVATDFGAADAGSAIVFTRNAGNTGFNPGLELPNPTPAGGDNCGSVVTTGDVDGDGHGDAIMGCDKANTGGFDAGTVVVFARNAGNTGFNAGVEVSPTGVTDDICGGSVASGDVNGDGRDDLIAGCTQHDSGATDSGSMMLMTRNAANNGFDAATEIANPTPEIGDNCGFSVAAGDVDNDGHDDLAMGCHKDEQAAANAGTVVIVKRNAANNGFDAADQLFDANPGMNDFCGSGTALGDANNDHLDDVAMGCFSDDAGATDAGSVQLFLTN